MLAIATLVHISGKRSVHRVVRSASAADGWSVMQEAYRWLMKASPKQAEPLVVYPGVGTKEEHMDDRAVGSICRSELTDRDSASQYLSATARELDKILGQTRDPARRTKATALDVQVYMGRGRKWRVSIEYPLAAVFAVSGYPEHVIEIVEGRF